MIYLGCHLSASKGYTAMVKDAVSIGANTFAFFTRNPQGGAAKPIDEKDINTARELLTEYKFGKLVAHAPYTLNPCSDKESTREFAHMVFEDDLRRMEYVPGNYYNFHPGSHVGQGPDVGIDYIVSLLNDVLYKDQTTTVLLETMAGKGSEVGRTFEELAEILGRVKLSDKIGVCMDTCHVNDGGYDIVNNLDGVLTEFDKVIGLSRLKALHVNDSKNPLGAHKDRHANIGDGYLGSDAIAAVLNHPALKGLPAILETPQSDLSGYKKEIELLRGLCE